MAILEHRTTQVGSPASFSRCPACLPTLFSFMALAQGPLSLEPGMDSRSLSLAVRGFERSLSDLETFIMPHCDKLMVASCDHP